MFSYWKRVTWRALVNTGSWFVKTSKFSLGGIVVIVIGALAYHYMYGLDEALKGLTKSVLPYAIAGILLPLVFFVLLFRAAWEIDEEQKKVHEEAIAELTTKLENLTGKHDAVLKETALTPDQKLVVDTLEDYISQMQAAKEKVASKSRNARTELDTISQRIYNYFKRSISHYPLYVNRFPLRAQTLYKPAIKDEDIPGVLAECDAKIEEVLKVIRSIKGEPATA